MSWLLKALAKRQEEKGRAEQRLSWKSWQPRAQPQQSLFGVLEQLALETV